MKNIFYITFLFFVLFLFSNSAVAQCAVCTKTAMQLGEKPAAGLNSAILYLMAAPFSIIGFIGYRLWKGSKGVEEK